jgi:TRAP-type C4-dicarboxylate transport system permease small subunit
MAKKALHYLDQTEKTICVISITVMLVVLTFQVLSRYVLEQSNIWTEELARYLYIWLVFVGVSYAEKEFAHIKIDFLVKVFPKKFRPYAALLGEILLLVFSLYMVYIAASYVQGVVGRGQISQALKISMVFPYIAIPVGFALMALRVLINIFTKKYIPDENAIDLCDLDSNIIKPMEGADENSDRGVF